MIGPFKKVPRERQAAGFDFCKPRESWTNLCGQLGRQVDPTERDIDNTATTIWVKPSG
jgi:hypothetical protein